MKIVISVLLASLVLFGCGKSEEKISGLPSAVADSAQSSVRCTPADDDPEDDDERHDGDDRERDHEKHHHLKRHHGKHHDGEHRDGEHDDGKRCTPSGSLQITVSGLPAGVSAGITVSGPNGFSMAVTSTTTLNNLAPGSYSVSASPVTSGLATYNGAVTGSPATVSSGTVAQSSVTYAVVSGSLQITVSGLPAGVSAGITVSGPNGFSVAVTSTTTLNNLAPGSYSVSASPVTSGLATYNGAVTGSPATVSSGTVAQSSVTYAVVSGSLQITVSGLPVGVSAGITVAGPNGFGMAVTSTTTLNDLPPGSYSISASPVTSGLATYNGAVTGSPATVSSGTVAQSSVTYAVVPGSLQITVSGLPAGVSAGITVSGPNGFSVAVSSTTTLNNLAPGSYSTSASPVTSGPATYNGVVSGSPATVSSGTVAQSPVTYTVVSGSLQIAVSGLPAGVSAGITVAGPNGFGMAVTSTTTLNDLPPGSYSISASPVTSGLATYNGAVTGSPATVSSGTVAQSSVTYTVVSGNLQITVSGPPSPLSPDITVSGPNGYSQAVTGTVTLTSLTPGNYAVAANDVRGATYSYGATVSGSPAAVSSSSTAVATVSYAPITGALAITITGLPSTANANIVVTGPGGFNQHVTASGTLTNLLPGTYTVSADSARDPGAIVDQVFTGTGGSLTVSAGVTASISIGYSPRPGAGKLWIPRNASIIGYDASQVASTGSPAPMVTTDAPGLNEAVVFDHSGNEWVSSRTTNTLRSYTPSQITSSGSPTATVTISASPTGDSLFSPTGLAFDSGGNLWVANFGNSTVVKYGAAQLMATGSPAPSVIIRAIADSLLRPIALAFDSGGNLWVSNSSDFSNTIVEFTPAQLDSTGSPVPSVTISATAASLSRPFGLAFDGSGSLWVTNFGNSTVVKFTSPQLASTGSPAPSVILSANALNGPSALAFDNGGNLWVVNTTAQTLVQFGTSQLGASGAPAPAVTISSLGFTDVAAFSFNPPPANSPIRQ